MPTRPGLWTLSGLATLLLACAPSAAPPPAEGARQERNGSPQESPLLASVQASTAGDSVDFLLQVTNTSTEPVRLEFTSGQSFDFVVTRDGAEVWRWSADRMFTQALRSEMLAAGATRSFNASWMPPPGARGEYTVTGALTVSNHEVEQSTRFAVGEE